MKAIFALLLLVPLVAYAAELPQFNLYFLKKLLAFMKRQVDKIVAEVEKIKKEVEDEMKKLDPVIIKDLGDIVNNIVGLADAGMQIASGVLALCKEIPDIPDAVFDFIKAGFAIFQDISHIILDVIDIVQRIIKDQGHNKMLDAIQTKLERAATSFKNAENQLQAQLDKAHKKLEQPGKPSVDFDKPIKEANEEQLVKAEQEYNKF